MSARSNQQIQVLYEIALSISPEQSLSETVDRALSTYLQKLNCAVGAVFESSASPGVQPTERDTADQFPYTPIVTVPEDPEANPVYTRAKRRLPADEFPMTGTVDDGTEFVLMELPGFGALLLGKQGAGFDPTVIRSLVPLNEKLAEVCRTKRIETALREQRNRFEVLFGTLDEPIVNTVVQDGTEIIKQANRSFHTTFEHGADDLVGEPLTALPVSEPAGSSQQGVSAGPTQQTPVEIETVGGSRQFLTRAVSVETNSPPEQFRLYIDITEQYERQRTLQKLHTATDEILTTEDREKICRQAVETAASVFDLSSASILLYNRQSEALVPVATVEKEQSGESTVADLKKYTDTETAVWDAYENGGQLFDNSAEAGITAGQTTAESAIVVSLGHHGVLIATRSEPRRLDETDFQYTQLLSQFVETALTRSTREQGLAEIQSITREIINADTHDAIAETLMRRLPEGLSFPICTLWRYDAANEALVPVATTDAGEQLIGTVPTIGPGEGIAWTVYETGETEIVTDVSARPDSYNQNSPIGSEIMIAVGEYGVLATGATRPQSFTETEQRLVETLGKNVEAAIELVTQRRELQQRERELQATKRSLERSKSRIEETNSNLETLNRVLRHDIRNDVSVIAQTVHRLEQLVDAENNTVTGHFDRLLSRTEHIRNLTLDLRDLMQTMLGEDTELSQIRLDTVLNAEITDVTTTYEDAEITVEGDLPAVTVRANQMLSSVFQNLLDNAITHNDAAVPQVTVSVTERDNTVIIKISDNGPGIPEPLRDDIFLKGERGLESRGTGIGLYLVAELVDQYNGSVTAESAPTGKRSDSQGPELDESTGTTFTVELQKISA
ncbi:MAG: signal transduction histidine kinase [halophilic archaeon J07HX5]|jgi:Signal transduction histidine kinase|nr:MAG: signal transduction histidine kinase [halophilic archaeon J07HX5]